MQSLMLAVPATYTPLEEPSTIVQELKLTEPRSSIAPGEPDLLIVIPEIVAATPESTRNAAPFPSIVKRSEPGPSIVIEGLRGRQLDRQQVERDRLRCVEDRRTEIDGVRSPGLFSLFDRPAQAAVGGEPPASTVLVTVNVARSWRSSSGINCGTRRHRDRFRPLWDGAGLVRNLVNGRASVEAAFWLSLMAHPPLGSGARRRRRPRNHHVFAT